MENFEKENFGMSRCEYAEERLKSERKKSSNFIKAIKFLAKENEKLKVIISDLESKR